MEDYINSKPLILSFVYEDHEKENDGFKVTYNPTSGDYTVNSLLTNREEKVKLIVSSIEGVMLLFKLWWEFYEYNWGRIKLTTEDNRNVYYNYCNIIVFADEVGEGEEPEEKWFKLKEERTEGIIKKFKECLTILSVSRSLKIE